MKVHSKKIVLILIIVMLMIGIFITLWSFDFSVENIKEAITQSLGLTTNKLIDVIDIPEIENRGIKTYSSLDNEKGAIMLGLLDINVTDVSNYALNINPKVDSAYAVVIIEAKDLEDVSHIKSKMEQYIVNKQLYLENIGSKASSIARNSVIFTDDKLVVMVMDYRVDDIMDSLRKNIDKLKRENQEGELKR